MERGTILLPSVAANVMLKGHAYVYFADRVKACFHVQIGLQTILRLSIHHPMMRSAQSNRQAGRQACVIMYRAGCFRQVLAYKRMRFTPVCQSRPYKFYAKESEGFALLALT